MSFPKTEQEKAREKFDVHFESEKSIELFNEIISQTIQDTIEQIYIEVDKKRMIEVGVNSQGLERKQLINLGIDRAQDAIRLLATLKQDAEAYVRERR